MQTEKKTIRRMAIYLLLGAIFLGGCWYVVENRLWQSLDFDRAWCEKVITAANPLINALEKYKTDNGAYPKILDALLPKYLKVLPTTIPHPKRGEGTRWGYEIMDDGNYILYVTVMHWVSSFDVFIFKSSKQYPDSWAEGRNHFAVKDWKYYIGGHRLEGVFFVR